MKNRITKRFVMAAILCVLIMALAAPALAASYSKVYGQTQDRVRVRASASSGATVIDNIVKNACVYVTDSKTSGGATYVQVKYRNSNGDVSTGWLCQNDGKNTFVKILSAEQAKKSFSVEKGNLPSRKVGTFSASERKEAANTPSSAGGNSDAIKRVQTMLKELKYYSGDVTGNVGDKTKEAIKQFQREYDLTADGVAGPATIAKLESVYKDKFGAIGTPSSGSGLKLGSTGAKVRDLQLDLTTLGYYWADITGSFGSKTEAAVKNFQEKNGLTADGVAGPKTINAIAAAIARKGGSSNSSYATGTTLRLNSQGSAVADLQTDLKQLGYYYADITGKFGSKTEAAVKSFQKDKGLYADGVAGSKTLAAVAKAVGAAGGSVNNSSTGLKLGSTGDKVRDLQADLTALGFYYGDLTGHYGSMTQTAVKKFQKSRGLVQDGVAGQTTINAIISALKGSGSSSSSGGNAGKSLREGDTGEAVREMQEMLKDLGYYYGSITGSFGSLTKKAVRAFQDAQGLTVDGIAGTNTLNKLYALSGKTNTSGGGASGTTVKEEDSYGRVNKDNVNLRSSYSTTSAAKASLSEGKLLRITKVYNVAGVKWYYVTVKTGDITHKGYLRADMVTKISESDYNSGGGGNLDLGDGEILGMIRITGTSVNLREEPSTDAKKVGTAKKGDVFYYVNRKSGWFQTKAGYWISKDYAEVLTDEEAGDYEDNVTNDSGSYRNGDTGSMVLWIQQALHKLGFYNGDQSGHFGDKTEEAVRQFQRAHGLGADGVAGPKTIAKIVEELGNEGGSSGGSGEYNKTIYNVDWFANKAKILKTGDKATVIDLETGRTFEIYVQSTGNHADVEPWDADDTRVLCGLYGVANASQLESQNKYQRRAVLVENAAGLQFIGSIYAIPHGLNTRAGNNFDGQFCIHFKGSTIHAGDGGSVAESENHQAKITKAAKTLKDAGYEILTEIKN